MGAVNPEMYKYTHKEKQMKSINSNILTRFLALVLTLSLILSVFTACDAFSYVADGKTEIQQNIDSTPTDTYYQYVSDYLREWGMPVYDTMKFKYFEDCFLQLFNHKDGMPDVMTHAKLTAASFLENYYDKIDIGNKTQVTDAMLDCFVSALGDPYSAYRPPVETDEYLTDMSGKFGGIGVMVEYNDTDESIMVNTVYPDSPAEKAGVKVGDFIIAVDGKTVDEVGYLNAVNYVRGEIGTKVELTLLRGDQTVTVVATRAEVEEINAAYEIDTENNIGYVQIVAFKKNTADQFKAAIDALEAAGVDGIVFDLRNNPGGYVDSVVSVISYLVPNGTLVMSYQYKGRDRTVRLTRDDGEDHVVDLPFVVLCNEYTASAGEIFTAALRDYRNSKMLDATIVGTTTYKKGVMQDTYYYPLDESTVTLTVAYYDPPCGINYDGIGVTPDRVVEYDGGETDNQLEAGIEELKKLINAN